MGGEKTKIIIFIQANHCWQIFVVYQKTKIKYNEQKKKTEISLTKNLICGITVSRELCIQSVNKI